MTSGAAAHRVVADASTTEGRPDSLAGAVAAAVGGPPPARRWGGRGFVASYRVGILVVCIGLSLRPPHQLLTFLVLLPLALLALAAYRDQRVEHVLPYAGSLLVAAAVPMTGGPRSALLPYLLSPGITLGLSRGMRQLSAFTATTLLVLAVDCALVAPAEPLRWLSGTAEWVLLAAAVGAVAVYARATVPQAPPEPVSELREALRNLRELTHRLPGGLDAASTAEALLEEALAVSGGYRGAVLIGVGEDRFTPLATRGAARVPWREPTAGDGPLREAWERGRPVVDRRPADSLGRRHGGALAAVPVVDAGEPLGLVVVECRDPDGLGPAQVAAVDAVVARAAPLLDVALLFDEIRLEASADERDRLAREMHDGIAQELAFVGYRLDAAQGKAAAQAPELVEELRDVRRGVTALVSDLRLSITDLRTTMRPDRGLGAVLGTYVRSAFSGRGVTLTLELQESAFRLGADVESALFAVVQAFVQRARRLPVRAVTVALESAPPSARLLLSETGAAIEASLPDDLRRRLDERGAEIVRMESSEDVTVWEVRVKEATDADPGPAGR